MVAPVAIPAVPRWSCFERSFTSQRTYANPVQETRLHVEFTAPSGHVQGVEGFWDGKLTWRVRFAPDELGVWKYVSRCSDTDNNGLHQRKGEFICSQSEENTRFGSHGSVQVSANRHYLAHADGTPFFWIADTAWNGPLLSTASEWDDYLKVRVEQKFTAVQWVATHWLASPKGDRAGRKPYLGDTQQVNPAFFQSLDAKCRAINRAGLLSIPVMLWAGEWHPDERQNLYNPGKALPESQAIELARYMLARWGAYHVVWILAGDAGYTGEKAERWKRIGQAVFAEDKHAPVIMHPSALSYPHDEFAQENWLDLMGYQSGHGSDDASLGWLFDGDLAERSRQRPPRPILNLEPAYENHVDLANPPQRWTAAQVRNVLYWSLMVTPTAGVSYGGHGVWEWGDGSTPPPAHEHAGIPWAWLKALKMEAADQVAHLADCFAALEWWRLRPAPELIAYQPGEQDKSHTITAACSDDGKLAVVYLPYGGRVALRLDGLQVDLSALWFNPRNGSRLPATMLPSHGIHEFVMPDDQDWLLILKDQVSIPIRPA